MSIIGACLIKERVYAYQDICDIEVKLNYKTTLGTLALYVVNESIADSQCLLNRG